MDGNFAWQKHRVNERIEARRREAEMHRLAQRGERRPRPLVLGLKAGVMACRQAIARLWPRKRGRLAPDRGEPGVREVIA